MSLPLQIGATLKPNASALLYQDGATLRTMSAAYFQMPTGLEQVWGGSSYVEMTGSINNVSGSGTGSGTLAVGTCTATVNGGNATKTFTWSVTGSGFYVSGTGASVTIRQSYAGYSTFTGTVQCVVADGTDSITLSGTIHFVRWASYTAMTGSIDNVTGSGSGSGTLTVGTASLDVSGGDSPFDYDWSISSGSNFTLNPAGDSCAISQTDSTAASYSETITCVVTDASSHVMTRTATVSFTRSAIYVPMSGSISPSSLSASWELPLPPESQQPHVGDASISVDGGDAPLSYAWSANGTGSFTVTPGDAASVSVGSNHTFGTGTFTGTLTCVVTDASSHTLNKSIPLSITFTEAPPTYTPMTGSLPDIDRAEFVNRTTGLWAGGIVGTATASVQGGSGSYTHSFSVSGTGWSVSGSGATATVSSTVPRPPGTQIITLTDVVTDGEGDPLTLHSTVTLTVQAPIGQ